MGSLSTNEQRKLAYFHALAKVMTENAAQEVYESRYKSSHNISLDDVWADKIDYSPDYTSAYNQSLINSALTLREMVTLTPIPGSNGMAYYYNLGGKFIRPWIAPTDVPDKISNLPSNGFDVKLYKQDNTQIGATQGAWAVDYYAGIIHFGQYNTPSDLGWGNIRATFFEYTGAFGVSGITYNGFTTVQFIDTNSTLVFNSGQTSEYVVDLSSLKGGSSGVTSKLSYSNENMNALTTVVDGDLACNNGLMDSPLSGSTIAVFINGVRINVGGLNSECYFSNDNGLTAKTYSNIEIGDMLYWNPSISGYNLDSNKDKISFIYLTV